MKHDPKKLRQIEKVMNHLEKIHCNRLEKGWAAIVICGNDETISDCWRDVYTNAEIMDFEDGEIGNIWHAAFLARLLELLPGAWYTTNSNFQYWHGGPGRTIRDYDEFGNLLEALEAVIDDCRSVAEQAAWDAATQDVAEYKRMIAEEAEC